jgi:hypothetical protein
MEGEKDKAWCPECGVRFSRGGVGGRIRIEDGSGGTWEVPSSELSAAVARRDEVRSEGWSHQARASIRTASHEVPFHFRGELLGYAEVFGPQRDGILEIDTDMLWFRPDGEGVGESPEGWTLLDIRAVQTSSSALQFANKDGTLVQFRFQDDSTRRWEGLLRGALKAIYRKRGLGEIVEFQPRIVVEP